MEMDMTYADVYMLLQKEPAAREYFDALPSYVQDQIASRPGGVNSFAGLRDYAENLTRGDG